MKKRLLLRLGLLGLLAFVCLWLFLWWTAPNHRINQSYADQIRKGMTEDEVIQLLGLPPGDYTGARKMHARKLREAIVIELDQVARVRGCTYREWLTDEGALFVVFAKNGEVACSYYEKYPNSLLETCRDLLRIR